MDGIFSPNTASQSPIGRLQKRRTGGIKRLRKTERRGRIFYEFGNQISLREKIILATSPAE